MSPYTSRELPKINGVAVRRQYSSTLKHISTLCIAPVRLLDQLEHFRMRREMDDRVEAPGRRQFAGRAAIQVADLRGQLVRPRIRAAVQARHRVPARQELQRYVRADLPAGAGDQNAHDFSGRRGLREASSVRPRRVDGGAGRL